MNWKEFHAQMANGYKSVASEYRQTAEAIVDSDPDLAGFCLTRAEINEQFATEQEQLAADKQYPISK